MEAETQICQVTAQSSSLDLASFSPLKLSEATIRRWDERHDDNLMTSKHLLATGCRLIYASKSSKSEITVDLAIVTCLKIWKWLSLYSLRESGQIYARHARSLAFNARHTATRSWGVLKPRSTALIAETDQLNRYMIKRAFADFGFGSRGSPSEVCQWGEFVLLRPVSWEHVTTFSVPLQLHSRWAKNYPTYHALYSKWRFRWAQYGSPQQPQNCKNKHLL